MMTFTKEQLIASARSRIEFAEMMLAGEQEPLKERTWSIELELARIALESLELQEYRKAAGEPVAFDALRDAVAEVTGGLPVEFDEGHIHKGHQSVPFMNFNSLSRIVEKFRATQPAPAVEAVPVVPDEVTVESIYPDVQTGWQDAKMYAEGWNACRTAMQQPLSNRDELPEETGSLLQLRNLIRQRHAEWSQATFSDVGPVGPLKHLSKEALEAAAEPGDLSEWADMQFLLWDAQRRAGLSDGEITAAMEEKLKVNMARQWPEPKDGEPRLHIKAAPQQEKI